MTLTNNRKMKVLVVGVEGLMPILANSNFEITGVIDLYGQAQEGASLEDSAKLSSLYRKDILEAIASEVPDLAWITVPNNRKNTVEDESFLLHKGIDVWVQKLRLAAKADIERLSTSSNNSKATFLVGEHYRYLPHIRTLKKLIQEGWIGEAEYVQWNCFLPIEGYPWMKAYSHLTLEDLSYHHFGVLHYLLGFHPNRLYAQSFKPSFSKAAAKTSASVIAETLEGYRLHYSAIWGSRMDRADYLGEILIEGTKGSLLVSQEQVIFLTLSGKKKQIPCLSSPYEGSNGILKHFYDYTNNLESKEDDLDGQPFTIQQFEPVLRAIYGAVESAESNRVIEEL